MHIFYSRNKNRQQNAIFINKHLQLVTVKLFYAIFFTGLLFACRKMGMERKHTNGAAFAMFFKMDKNVDGITKIFANRIQEENSQYEFIPYFIEKNGYADWNNSINIQHYSQALSIIPVVLKNESKVNAIIIGRKMDNKYIFHLYRKDLLPLYGFADTGVNKRLGQRVQSLFNYFNAAMFGVNTCRLPDLRLLPASFRSAHPMLNDPTKFTGRFKHDLLGGRRVRDSTNAFGCFTITEETEWWYNPNGDVCNCDGDEYYAYSTYQTTTVCAERSFEDDDDPKINWWMGGGGGGGPYDPGVPSYMQAMSDCLDAINLVADSVFKLINSAASGYYEYTFAMVKKNGVIRAKNIMKMKNKNGGTTDTRLDAGETLAGTYHTHPDDSANASPGLRPAPSIEDIFYLKWHVVNDYTDLIDVGTKKFAFVIIDAVKARNFFATNEKKEHIADNYRPGTGGGSYQKMTTRCVINALQSATISGIGFYEITSSGTTHNFTLKNP